MTTQDVALRLLIGGVWTPVPLYAAAGVTITRGMAPGGSWPDPSNFECEINNDSLNYDPSRPEATLYGVAGRNTPARISVAATFRLWAEASRWVPERSLEHEPGVRGRAWVKLTAEGVLRRLSQWSEPLRSPMYRTISGRASNIGHWSLEDDKDAASLADTSQAVPSTPGAFKGGATLGESDGPDGAGTTVKVTASSQLSGRFSTASGTAGWQVSWSYRMPAVPASATYGEVLRWTTSAGHVWLVEVNNTTYRISVTEADGTSLSSNVVTFGGRDPNQWITMRVKASAAAGTVTLEPAWYAQGDVVEAGTTHTFAGAVGALRNWWQNGNAVIDGSWFSHVFGVTGGADNLVGFSAQRVFNGYRGETARDRMIRLCDEHGVKAFATANSGGSQPMGPQRPDTLLALLREVRDTDDCRIDDERFDIALTFTARRAMYGLTPALTLTYPAQVKPPFTKIIGDLGTRNHVTVKNRDGGEATAVLHTGPMSVQPPPAGVGETRGSVDVNVATEAGQLDDIASWHLAKGTLDRPRYDEVSVDLLANPGLTAAVSAVREGNMIQVDGYEPDPIQLLVVGIVDKAGAVERTVTFRTEPYEPYQVDVWDAATFRWDSRTTTMAADATATATTLPLTTTDPADVWSTTPGYQLMVGGERVTVTAMTAPAGTGPYTQTATVTRSVNGVVKAQRAGTEVHLADPKRWGL